MIKNVSRLNLITSNDDHMKFLIRRKMALELREIY